MSKPTFPLASIDRAAIEAYGGDDVSLAGRLHGVACANIRSGAWPPAMRLPSIRAMARACDVGPETVVRAYDRLVRDGLAEAIRGSGFYVRAAPCPRPAGPTPPSRLSVPHWNVLVANDLPLDRRPGTGVIHPDFLPTEDVARAARAALRTRPGLLTDPGDAAGYLPLRSEIARDLALDGIPAPAASIVTAHGATGGLNVVVRALLRPGQTAIVEEPGPFLHTALLLSQGVEVETVPRRADGPDIAALRAVCERTRPRLFLCSTLGHNPTGGAITPYTAHRILRLAEEFDMTVVDDATYAGLVPARQRTATPLAALDGLHLVIHVGSFSRTVGGGLGVGYLVADGRLQEWLRLYRSIQSLSGPLFGERTLYHLMAEGRFRRGCDLLAARLVERRALVVGWLEEAGFAPPAGGAGPFLWLSLGPGADAGAVAARMRMHDHVVTGRHHFSYSPRHDGFTRLNVTTTTRTAIRLLADAVRHGRDCIATGAGAGPAA